ncbi:MAG: hypothetical protein AAF798_19630 [Bacteroidota bacterium]
MNDPKIILCSLLLLASTAFTHLAQAQNAEQHFSQMLEALASKKAIHHAYRVTTTVEAAGTSQTFCGEGQLSLRAGQLKSGRTPQGVCQVGAASTHTLGIKMYTTGAGNVVVMVHSSEDDWTRRLQNIELRAASSEMIITGQYIQDQIVERYRIAVPLPGALMANR